MPITATDMADFGLSTDSSLRESKGFFIPHPLEFQRLVLCSVEGVFLTPPRLWIPEGPCYRAVRWPQSGGWELLGMLVR